MVLALYKHLCVSELTTEQWLNIYQLAACQPLPKISGKYYKQYWNADTFNLPTFLLVNSLWRGVRFDKNNCTLFSFAGIPLEKGEVSIADSVYGGQPCIRVDFQNRFYEIRQYDPTYLINVVTSKDHGQVILDINMLYQKK